MLASQLKRLSCTRSFADESYTKPPKRWFCVRIYSMNHRKWLYLAFILVGFSLLGMFWGSKNINDRNAPIQMETKTPSEFTHLSSDFDLNISQEVYAGNQNKIYGGIVPHHLLASSIINETMGRISSSFNSETSIKQVVLLSPNHFIRGSNKVITSDGDWKTKFGVLEGDRDFVKNLEQYNLAQIDYQPIEQDHGVFNLMPFIKHFFPSAKVIPLMLKEPLTEEELSKLASFLDKNLGDGSLILVSADFSHYLPKNVADFHDKTSLASLYNFDLEILPRIDVDTPSSLGVLLRYLKLKNSQKFVLVKNMNSADFVGGNGPEETTSYVSGYFINGYKASKDQITFLTVGDIMLDRNVSILTEQSGDYNYPFSKIELLFKGIDTRLANLEGTITNFSSTSIKDNGLKFTFSPRFLEVLKNYFDVFSLANNHTQDFGENGFQQTQDFLRKNGIGFFGDNKNRKDFLSHIISKNNVKIGFIGYHSLWSKNLSVVLSEIKDLKSKCDFVVILPHWGEEYKQMPSPEQIKEARLFIDSGADLILGSHPHVIQPIEIYKNKVIFYSLGNFVFDQYFSKETSRGLGIGVVLSKDVNINTTYYLFPVIISNKSQSELASLQVSKEILEQLSNNSNVNKNIKDSIKSGFFSLSK